VRAAPHPAKAGSIERPLLRIAGIQLSDSSVERRRLRCDAAKAAVREIDSRLI
jgi:hypothetical protein